MDWRDEGIVLAVRPLGETSLLVSVLTAEHGRHAGLVRGGAGGRNRAAIGPGTRVAAAWRARLAEQLGTFTLEAERSYAGAVLADRLALAGLASALSLTEAALPERAPEAGLFAALDVLLARLGESGVWPALLVRYELGLLEALGYGLALERCAVTGTREDLSHVSPRTGRAVSRAVAMPFGDRLLRLPAFLLASQAGSPGPQDILDGLALTGSFLASRVFHPLGRAMPLARLRLAALLAAEARRCRSA